MSAGEPGVSGDPFSSARRKVSTRLRGFDLLPLVSIAARCANPCAEDRGRGSLHGVVRYNPVILGSVKTAISLSDDTFCRVDRAAKRLGVSRSEFFARAAESWLRTLEEEDATEAINRALRGSRVDHEFTDAAASALAAADSAG